MGHKQTPGYHKTRVLSKLRLFDLIQSEDSDSIRFEKLDSCAALVHTCPKKPKMALITDYLPAAASADATCRINIS